MTTTEELLTAHCIRIKKADNVRAMPKTEAEQMLNLIPGWQLDSEDGRLQIVMNLETRNFKQALELANAIGALAEEEKHHPDIKIGWGKCNISLTTHDVG